MIANVNRDAKKKKEPFSAVDFMPKFGEPAKEEKRERDIVAPETLAWFDMMAARTERGELPKPKSSQ